MTPLTVLTVINSVIGAVCQVGPSVRQKCNAVRTRCLRKMSENEFDSIYTFFLKKQAAQVCDEIMTHANDPNDTPTKIMTPMTLFVVDGFILYQTA